MTTPSKPAHERSRRISLSLPVWMAERIERDAKAARRPWSTQLQILVEPALTAALAAEAKPAQADGGAK